MKYAQADFIYTKIMEASKRRCMKPASPDFRVGAKVLKGRYMKFASANFILRDQNGGALIEFAIVLPILMLLVAGIADFGILFYDKQVLTNACREGARAGIVYQLDADGNKEIITEADIQDVVENYCKDKRLWTFGGSSLPATTAPGVNSLAYPSDLTVTASFTYTFLLSSILNMFGGDFGPTLDISAFTVMRME
jgi:Flp pilus assembly protein TadG